MREERLGRQEDMLASARHKGRRGAPSLAGAAGIRANRIVLVADAHSC